MTAPPRRSRPFDQRARRWLLAWRRVDAPALVLVPGLVGVLTGGAAIAFVELVNLVQLLAIGSTHEPVAVLPEVVWYRALLAPAIGGLLVGPLLHFLAPEAGGHGVPEVIEAVALRGGRIRRRVAAVKAIASALTIGSGGSVGREGPIVQIGAAVASATGQALRLPPERLRTLAACGAAAGIAAVFNAPIAGAFFSLEIITGNFAMPSFGPVILASVLGTMVSRAHFGDYPAFIVQPYELESPWEIGSYALLGIACGVVGATFIAALETAETWSQRLPLPRLWHPALGGLLVGAMIVFVPELYGVGYATMDGALAGSLPWTLLAVLLVLKIAATSITLASGGSGGAFIPALYVGSIAGGLFGTGVHALWPAVTAGPGAYALVGMAGVLSAAMHAPITAMILLFEMSGDYKIILPVMIVVTLATAVGRALRQDSLYTAPLRRRGISVDRREDAIMRSQTVGQAMRPARSPLAESTPVGAVAAHFLESGAVVAYVVDDAGHFTGSISIHDIMDPETRELGALLVAGDLAQRDPSTARPEDTLATCMERFVVTERDELPVVGGEGTIEGVISRRDILAVYNRELLRHEFLGVRHGAGDASGGSSLRLERGVTIARLAAPRNLVGRSLRDADLRAAHRLTVIAVQRAGKTHDEMPDPEQPVAEGDVLVVVGTAEDLQLFGGRSA